MLKNINKSQIQKFPATRSSVITPFWFSAKTTSRYYVYLYLNKICLFLVEQWVILNCLGLFQICMDTKLKKKLNCHCAVTTCSRKASFFRMAELPGQLFTCSVTFWKVMEKKGKLSTKWIVPLIAQCWLGRISIKFGWFASAKAKDELQSSPSWAKTHQGMAQFSAVLAAWVRSPRLYWVFSHFTAEVLWIYHMHGTGCRKAQAPAEFLHFHVGLHWDQQWGCAYPAGV